MIFGLWFRGDAKGATPLDVKKLTCTRVKFLTSVGLQITARQRGRQNFDGPPAWCQDLDVVRQSFDVVWIKK